MEIPPPQSSSIAPPRLVSLPRFNLLTGFMRSLALAVVAVSPGFPAAAEGFRSPTTGAAGLGATGGRIAFIDDASAVFHNPANLVDLERWEASAEPTFVHHAVHYTSPGGATASTEDPWKILPHLFAAGPVGDGGVAVGLGVTVPYGLSVDWGSGGALRYVASRFVELKTFNFNPTVAFPIVKGLNLGLGIDVMYSDLTLSRFTPLSLLTGIPGLPDGDLRAHGTGTGAGANLGLTWDFLPCQRLAVTFRAPMDIHYEGNLRATGIPGGSLLVPFESRIRFPTVVAVGYGVALTDTVRIEADVEWLQFSRFDTLPLEVPEGALGPFQLLVPSEVRQDWNDTFTAGISGTWDVGSGWRLRASYQYFQTPVPEYTYSAEIPDANQHAVAVGVEYRHGQHRLGLAYSRVFYEDRNIDQNQNPFYFGKYQVDVHLISAAYGFSF